VPKNLPSSVIEADQPGRACLAVKDQTDCTEITKFCALRLRITRKPPAAHYAVTRAATSGWVLLCSRRLQLDAMPFPLGMPGSLDQASCSRYASDHGVRELISAGHGRAQQSCDGHCVQIGLLVEVTGFLPAAQAVRGGLEGQLRAGATLAVESLVAAQQLPVGQGPRRSGAGWRRSTQSPAP